MHAAVAAQVIGALCFSTVGVMIARKHRQELLRKDSLPIASQDHIFPSEA